MKKSEKDLQVDALEENAKIEEELKSLEEEIKSRNTESAGEEIEPVTDEEFDQLETSETEIVDEMVEIEPTDEELDEIRDPSSSDPDYLEYSAEAVGYENREQQWDTYRIISGYVAEGDSVLDYGCARGDFERFYETEYNETLDYIGVDMNRQLIDAGKKVYEDEVELRCMSWFDLEDDVRDDKTYLQDTIKSMMAHCEKGSVILLASDLNNIDDGLINWNAGEIFNWAQKEFGSVALDHSFSDDIFTIIIYKTEK